MTETRPEVTGQKLHTTSTSTPKKIRQRHVRRHIELPGGRTLMPRAEFADLIGESERSTRRRNLPTVRIAGVSYVERDRSLEIVATEVRRPNQKTTPVTKPRRPKSAAAHPGRTQRCVRRGAEP